MGTRSGQEEKKRKKFHLFRRRGKKALEEQELVEKQREPSAAPNPSTLPRVVRVNSDLQNRATKNGVGSASNSPKKATEKKKLKSSWLARRKSFIKMTDQAFALVDADNSGEVDEKELYSGLLLIHLKLGCYAGPAACKPVSRERVHEIFIKMDVDGSGSLDRTEFREVMMILFSNVLLRVIVQWSMTLMIVPLVAQYILNAIYFVWDKGLHIVMELDEHSSIFNAIEIFVENTRDMIIDKTPSIIKWVVGLMDSLIQKVPDSVWNTIPLTLLSCILGCIAVPWLLFRVDDYFQNLAHKKVH